jgi:hypothetical protein
VKKVMELESKTLPGVTRPLASVRRGSSSTPQVAIPGHGAAKLAADGSEGAYKQGFYFQKLKFIGVIDKEDKQDISEISDQIQIKFNLNLSKFK